MNVDIIGTIARVYIQATLTGGVRKRAGLFTRRMKVGTIPEEKGFLSISGETNRATYQWRALGIFDRQKRLTSASFKKKEGQVIEKEVPSGVRTDPAGKERQRC